MKRLSIGLFAICSLLSVAAHAAETPVAKLGTTVFTEEEMKKDLAVQIYQAENNLYSVKRGWIDQKAQNMLFDQAAKAAKMSRSAWEAKEIDAKATPPDPTQIQQVATRFSRPGTSPAEAEKAAKDALMNQAKQVRRAQVYAELLQKTPLEVLIPAPVAPAITVKNPKTAPSKGPANAKVTVTEFTDYECPWCKKSQENVKEVEKAYGDKIKLVTRNFPLSNHPNAMPAAEAAVCAQDQGKFWQYRDKLFEMQPKLSAQDLEQYAKDLGLNMSKFRSCVSSHKHKARVEADLAEGQRLGVRGTPSFFVNNTQVGFPELMTTIQAELNKVQ